MRRISIAVSSCAGPIAESCRLPRPAAHSGSPAPTGLSSIRCAIGLTSRYTTSSRSSARTWSRAARPGSTPISPPAHIEISAPRNLFPLRPEGPCTISLRRLHRASRRSTSMRGPLASRHTPYEIIISSRGDDHFAFVSTWLGAAPTPLPSSIPLLDVAAPPPP